MAEKCAEKLAHQVARTCANAPVWKVFGAYWNNTVEGCVAAVRGNESIASAVRELFMPLELPNAAEGCELDFSMWSLHEDNETGQQLFHSYDECEHYVLTEPAYKAVYCGQPIGQPHTPPPPTPPPAQPPTQPQPQPQQQQPSFMQRGSGRLRAG